MTRRSVVVLLAAAVAITVGAWMSRRADPVDIAVVDPAADSLDALVARADMVVVGRIIVVAPGRVLSDPIDPDRAVRTQLARLAIDEVTVAPVGSQGRYLLDPDDPATLVPPVPDDPLAARLAHLGPRGLRTAVLDVTAGDPQRAP